jgi:hypothetical protein
MAAMECVCADVFRATAQCTDGGGGGGVLVWVLLAVSIAVHARGLCHCEEGDSSDEDTCSSMYT